MNLPYKYVHLVMILLIFYADTVLEFFVCFFLQKSYMYQIYRIQAKLIYPPFYVPTFTFSIEGLILKYTPGSPSSQTV